ncbi:ion transporter [Pseudomonas oryzae]|uniref:Voltage-gated potassium channel n=1 Tax=Pseudomonas oryzae TaxID=1392877 RepID=A0A1H1M2J7_9PSED|nr:ion transporter [Pseudomonas oryzae]SDR80981.1 voltage-gated potassium channel [Pseudomonas oryzae]
MPASTPPHALRQRLYTVIFQNDTRAGLLFDKFLLVTILASLLVVMLDSVASVSQAHGRLLSLLEWSFTSLFALEYLLRLYCSPRPLRYAFSFYGLIDLLAVLPGILALAYGDAQYLLIVRVLRMLRVFRVLKLAPYLSQANFLLVALRGSRQKIIVFLLSVSTLVTVFGTLMYVIEGPAHGFTSIPVSIYWAVVTLTTVGFGDITPKSPLGQGLATLIMITGYSIIAVPTGIFTAELANAMRTGEGGLQHSCPTCDKPSHEAGASFCCRCGNPLFQRRGVD